MSYADILQGRFEKAPVARKALQCVELIVLFAVLISAAVFGLVHFDWGPIGIGQTAFVGLALACLKAKRNLWINILAHGYMETILIVQLFFVQGSQ